MCDERGDVADLIEANSEIAVLLVSDAGRICEFGCAW